MKRVIIESPYRGRNEKDRQANLAYARRCLKDSLDRGEAPICSHLLHTQVLDDDIPEERRKGMHAGWAWVSKADLMAFYCDSGMSEGMKEGMCVAEACDIPIVERYLDK